MSGETEYNHVDRCLKAKPWQIRFLRDHETMVVNDNVLVTITGKSGAYYAVIRVIAELATQSHSVNRWVNEPQVLARLLEQGLLPKQAGTTRSNQLNWHGTEKERGKRLYQLIHESLRKRTAAKVKVLLDPWDHTYFESLHAKEVKVNDYDNATLLSFLADIFQIRPGSSITSRAYRIGNQDTRIVLDSDPVQATYSSQVASWINIDFTLELSRYKNLVPRSALQECLENFRNDDALRYLLLVADPGMGKTAFIAAQVANEPKAIFHLIIRNQFLDDPDSIIKSLILKVIATCGLPSADEITRNSLKLHNILQTVLREASSRGHQLIIFIDGLDETYGATSRHSDKNPRDLLPNLLPAGIKMVITSRPGSHLDALLDYEGLREHRLSSSSAESLDDIRCYLMNRSECMHEPLTSELIDAVTERSNGNFLFAVKVADDLERMPVVDRLVEDIPSGIAQWIAAEWHRLCQAILPARSRYPQLDEQYALRVLGTIAIAYEPLNCDEICSAIAAEDVSSHDAIQEILRLAAEFLQPPPSHDTTPSQLRFFHQSFADYVRHKLGTIREQDRHRELAIACKAAWRQPNSPLHVYALKYAASHLMAADMHEAFIKVVANPHYLDSRMELPPSNLLSDDLRRAIKMVPPETQNYILLELFRHCMCQVELNRYDPPYVCQQLYAALHNEIYRQGAQFHPSVHEWLENWAKELSTRRAWLRLMNWSGSVGYKSSYLSQVEPMVWPRLYTPDCKWVAENGINNVYDVHNQALQCHLSNHIGDACSIRVRHDGGSMLVAGQDGTAILWDMESGNMIRTLTVEGSPSHCVCYSPDGRYMATGHDDGRVALWDDDHTNPIKVIEEHKEPVLYIEYSPDGQRFLTTSGDRSCRVWNVVDGIPVDVISVLDNHDGAVINASFSGNGQLVATCSDEGTGKLWNSDCRLCMQTFADEWDGITRVRVRDDGRYVLTIADMLGECSVWSANTGRRVLAYFFSDRFLEGGWLSNDRLILGDNYGYTHELAMEGMEHVDRS